MMIMWYEVAIALMSSCIFLYLLYRKRLKGYILLGFALMLFSAYIDITDNFVILNKFVLIGNTLPQAFLEKIVGWLGGLFFLMAGLLHN